MISTVVSKENIKGNIIEIIDKKDINHLKNSFRLNVNDELRVVDGEYEYQTKIIEIQKKAIICEVIDKVEDRFSLDIKISAGIGMLKNDKMELTIQKLSELGIDTLIPLKLSRTIVKIDNKKEKWDIIAKEALKQCQGVKLMNIMNPMKLKEINYSSYDLILVPYENEEEVKIREVLKTRKSIKNILYIIGSEGGISKEEIEYLKEQKAEIITLGKRILRAETASIVVGGILTNEF